MKRTLSGFYATLILVVSFFALAACSSDDNTKDTTPKELPSFSDLTVAPGGTGAIEFNAYDVWKLSSDKIWFKLSANTGQAGDQKVTYTVTDDGLGFTDDVATLTFQIGTQSKTFTATRSAKEREIKFFSRIPNEVTGEMEYNEVTALDLTYQANANTYLANFAVVANFDWKVTAPEWISIDQDDMSGDANPGADTDPKVLSYKWVRINYAKATAKDMAGELTFSDKAASDKTMKLSITCPGSDNYMFTNATFEVKLNSEGQYVPSSGDPKDFYSFKVTAGNEGVMFFKVAKQNGFYGVEMGGGFNYNATWCQIFPNDSETVLGPSVKEVGYDLKGMYNNDAAREATVLAIPYPIVDINNITNAQDLVTGDDKEIKPEYQKYIITEVSQAGVAKEIVFAAYSAPEGISLTKLEAGSDDYDFIHSEYGVDLAYVMTFSSFDQVNLASLNFNGYTGSGDLIPSFNPSDSDFEQGGWLGMETNGGNYMVVNIDDSKKPFTGERSAWIIVKDSETFMNEFAIKVVQKVARPNN